MSDTGHVHRGEWCAKCVEHGVVEEVRRNQATAEEATSHPRPQYTVGIDYANGEDWTATPDPRPSTVTGKALLRRPHRAWPLGEEEWSATILLIEHEAAAAERARHAALVRAAQAVVPLPGHQTPGEYHDYRVACVKCGEQGFLHVSWRPETWTDPCSLTAAEHSEHDDPTLHEMDIAAYSNAETA